MDSEQSLKAQRFGVLQKVSASSVDGWTHEATDFTPWLAENLDLLGGELGLALELRKREHPVGRYSLDLLLEDAQGRVVIVENQFGQTDHGHLGKLLTYCAGTDAQVVIWLAESLTEEHAAALEWLNDNSAEGVDFFGVELELLRIDGSMPAPHFRLIVQPNEWKKGVRAKTGPSVEWGWEAYGQELGIADDRIRVGRALVDRVESVAQELALPWQLKFRKGYVAFQRQGGYNVVIVDLYWRGVPRLAVKIPAAPQQLGLESPYPDLMESWVEGEREWGWTVPRVEDVPDVERALELARPFNEGGGPMSASSRPR